MNTPNYPPQGGPQGPQRPGGGGPYGPPPPYGPPGGRPPHTPPGGQPYGPPPGGGRPHYGGPGGPGGYGPPGGGPGGPGGLGGPGGPYGAPPPGGPGQNDPYGPGPSDPYGGPPPGGQPMGEPQPGTPPPAPKKGNTKLIRIGAIVVIALAVIGVVFFLQKDAPASSKAGDCIHVKDAKNAEIEKVDCGSKEAMYTVGLTKDDSAAKCPNENYLQYTETGSSDVLLCLVLNAKDGDCFKSDGQVQVKTACGQGAEFKVAKVVKGSDDPKKCGAEEAANAVTFPEPKTTLCLAPPGGTAS
ncbi:MAG TPA: hypothetical protein VH969_01090 [Actinophytocola sp.]|uniref:LppU/SCO3897 family protein n=1 Tax=Actinophytocola sp. TaxID=1872138 RepID=UPI002F945E37